MGDIIVNQDGINDIKEGIAQVVVKEERSLSGWLFNISIGLVATTLITGIGTLWQWTQQIERINVILAGTEEGQELIKTNQERLQKDLTNLTLDYHLITSDRYTTIQAHQNTRFLEGTILDLERQTNQKIDEMIEEYDNKIDKLTQRVLLLEAQITK